MKKRVQKSVLITQSGPGLKKKLLVNRKQLSAQWLFWKWGPSLSHSVHFSSLLLSEPWAICGRFWKHFCGYNFCWSRCTMMAAMHGHRIIDHVFVNFFVHSIITMKWVLVYNYYVQLLLLLLITANLTIYAVAHA